jgi:hypothetical protein
LAGRFSLRGVISTAWSRYATSRVQSEPIDAALDVLIQVAHILHDGEPPTGHAVTELLTSTGEWARFKACHDSLSRLSEAKRTAWQCIIQAHQQAALERHDPTRRGAGVFLEMIRLAREQAASAQTAADAVRQALSGLVECIWIEEFITERLAALFRAIEACVNE